MPMNQRVTLSTEFNLIILTGIFIIKQVNLLKKKSWLWVMESLAGNPEEFHSESSHIHLFKFVY